VTVASPRRFAHAVLLVAFVAGVSHPAPLRAEPVPKPAQGAVLPLAARAVDAFYDPPRKLPRKPGTLLRSAPLKDVTLPAGMRGWRILYTTSIDDRTPATAVATVFAPSRPPKGRMPVIAWQHGTTGLLQKCMPSLMTHPALGIPALDRIARAGWAIVATDYPFAEKDGPHPYLIGEGEARAALDAVRAARQMRGVRLDARTAVWGHSQGGHAALWTGIVAPRYAPDVRLAGVAAIAPPTDIARLLTTNASLEKRLGPYIAQAYARFYSDVAFERAVRPQSLSATREIANLCGFLPGAEAQRTAALMASLKDSVLAANDAPLAARLAQNAPDRRIAAPLLVVQGAADTVVPPAMTDAYVEARCAAGQPLEYWRFSALDHGTIAQPGSLDEPLVAWTAARFAAGTAARFAAGTAASFAAGTAARFAGAPAQSGCVRKIF